MYVLITELLSGLALFLFGMKYMSDSLQQAAGGKLRTILDRCTKNKYLGVISVSYTHLDVYKRQPETRWVEGSNFVDINFKIDERTNRIIMMGALDNLIKGAAGQAVQNMNILFGLEEKEGLEQVPMFP